MHIYIIGRSRFKKGVQPLMTSFFQYSIWKGGFSPNHDKILLFGETFRQNWKGVQPRKPSPKSASVHCVPTKSDTILNLLFDFIKQYNGPMHPRCLIYLDTDLYLVQIPLKWLLWNLGFYMFWRHMIRLESQVYNSAKLLHRIILIYINIFIAKMHFKIKTR